MAKIRTNIGLSDSQREGAANILNGILADEYVLYTKTRNFHWNVTGPEFDDLHKFFEGQYEQIDEIIDEVAERVRALGKIPIATLGEFLKATRLKESTKTLTAVQMVEKLLEDHDTVIRQLRLRHANDYAKPPSIRTMRRWYTDRRWMTSPGPLTPSPPRADGQAGSSAAVGSRSIDQRNAGQLANPTAPTARPNVHAQSMAPRGEASRETRPDRPP